MMMGIDQCFLLAERGGPRPDRRGPDRGGAGKECTS